MHLNEETKNPRKNDKKLNEIKSDRRKMATDCLKCSVFFFLSFHELSVCQLFGIRFFVFTMHFWIYLAYGFVLTLLFDRCVRNFVAYYDLYALMLHNWYVWWRHLTGIQHNKQQNLMTKNNTNQTEINCFICFEYFWYLYTVTLNLYFYCIHFGRI